MMMARNKDVEHFRGRAGSGSRFRDCQSKIGREYAKRGKAVDSGAVCASIGRRAYGKKFQAMAKAGKKRAAKRNPARKKTPKRFTGAFRKNLTLAQLRKAHPLLKFGKGAGRFKHLVYVQFSSSADDREWAHTPGDLQKKLAAGTWGPGASAKGLKRLAEANRHNSWTAMIEAEQRKAGHKRPNPLHRVHGTLVPSDSTSNSLISLGVGIGALALLAVVTR